MISIGEGRTLGEARRRRWRPDVLKVIFEIMIL